MTTARCQQCSTEPRTEAEGLFRSRLSTKHSTKQVTTHTCSSIKPLWTCQPPRGIPLQTTSTTQDHLPWSTASSQSHTSLPLPQIAVGSRRHHGVLVCDSSPLTTLAVSGCSQGSLLALGRNSVWDMRALSFVSS